MLFGSFLNRFSGIRHNVASVGFQQVRNKWTDWRMLKDAKRRRIVVDNAKDRLRVNSLRKNTILPVELRELASAEIHAFPRDTSLVRVRERCAVTSRPRGIVHRWRVSRIVWRHFADYNKLSGVQRAMW
ncbi:28S ribosomal protein S14, mitochondrial [Sabethes cyaneus]|uniref:28S ribosomal protein S14, mitochondrial n=1 Tax=Sabethes cyaneus TaxID=53552 RepID=UPI00237E4580|nr:28S ribosomal protein S14, mitochondrial [Sabethes cyaneus]